MNALAVITFSLCLFFLRDYFLLQMGPARLLSVRLRFYAVVLLGSAFLVSGATSRLDEAQLLLLFRAPRVVLPIVALYAVPVAICLWIHDPFKCMLTANPHLLRVTYSAAAQLT